MVRPSVPNGIKMEKFVFDVFKFAKRFLVLDVPRQDEFAPLKNAEGAASCTPLHSRRSLAFLHHRWLIESGAIICSPTGEEIFPPKSIDDMEGEYPIKVEISPLLSYGGEGLEEIVRGKRLTSPIYLNS